MPGRRVLVPLHKVLDSSADLLAMAEWRNRPSHVNGSTRPEGVQMFQINVPNHMRV